MLCCFSWWRMGSTSSRWQVRNFMMKFQIFFIPNICIKLYSSTLSLIAKKSPLAENCLNCFAYRARWLNLHGLPSSTKDIYLGITLLLRLLWLYFGGECSIIILLFKKLPQWCANVYLKGNLFGLWPKCRFKIKREKDGCSRKCCYFFTVRTQGSSYHWKRSSNVQGRC